jgi:hypothetical protein
MEQKKKRCGKIDVYFVRFQVLTVGNMKMAAFWDIAPCSLVEAHGCFRGAYCLQHQNDYMALHPRKLLF